MSFVVTSDDIPRAWSVPTQDREAQRHIASWRSPHERDTVDGWDLSARITRTLASLRGKDTT